MNVTKLRIKVESCFNMLPTVRKYATYALNQVNISIFDILKMISCLIKEIATMVTPTF
jgi:hypothetical protein